MSDLRDARLKRALQQAPDGDLRPDARTRRQVLAAAREAVAPKPQSSWWVKVWQRSGDHRMPFNAALATVVLATLVTVLWYEREVPDARIGDAPATQPAPVKTPQPAPAPAPPAVPQVTPQPEPRVAPTAKPESPRSTVPATPSRPATPPVESQREQRAESSADALRDRDLGALAKSAPAPAAPAAAPMARAAPSELSAQRAASSAEDWTHLRVIGQGRSVEVTRDQAPRLAQLANSVMRDGQGAGRLEAPVSLRLELRRDGDLTAVMELAGPQVRWTRWRGGQSESLIASPPPAELQSLRDEIQRLLQR